jgi:CheY-like chemotaxis protein
VTARTGREALDHLEHGLRPAVAVMDVEMRVMGGLELLSRIRGTPAVRDMPVIVHSTMNSPHRAARDPQSPDAWLKRQPIRHRF